MTYARVVIVLHLYLLEQCLNPVFWSLIKTCNFVTFYKFLVHLGMHHTMLYYWNMIEPNDEQIHRELMLIPFLFASYENYVRSSRSYQEGWTWIEDLNICQKPTKYGQCMFCVAVKVDLENSKQSSFQNTIASTLSLITV